MTATINNTTAANKTVLNTEAVLRDMAFVLKMTQKVRGEIEAERAVPSKPTMPTVKGTRPVREMVAAA